MDFTLDKKHEMARSLFAEFAEKEVKPFNYNPPKDEWDKFLVNDKSNYEEEKNMKVKVRCVRDYFDLKLNKLIQPKEDDENYERIITRERAEEIIDKTDGAIEIIETIKEQKETADIPKKSTIKKQPKKEKAVR